MSRQLFGCAIAGALMLAGYTAEPVAVDSHTDVTTRMATIASRLGAVTGHHFPGGPDLVEASDMAMLGRPPASTRAEGRTARRCSGRLSRPSIGPRSWQVPAVDDLLILGGLLMACSQMV